MYNVRISFILNAIFITVHYLQMIQAAMKDIVINTSKSSNLSNFVNSNMT